MADQDTSDGHDDGAVEPPWMPYFGFEEPYPDQADAISTAIDAALDRGFLALEGPCGTGKTMAALTAAAYLIRETDTFENAVVITPVKQQLQQFIYDLRALNGSVDDQLRGLSLVGKRDLCPYEREGVFASDSSVHDRCSDLRENTASLVSAESSTDRAVSDVSEDSVDRMVAAAVDGDTWWDTETASALVREARYEPSPSNAEADQPLITAGARSPYPRTQPSASEEFVDGDVQRTFCPFEADWYARDKRPPVSYEDGIDSVITSDEFLPRATERGCCPHRTMQMLIEDAEIIIGNYNHLFDPATRALTDEAISDSTFVIVDEAHRLEGRLRDVLSDSIGRHTLVRAGGDLEFLRRWAEQDRNNEEFVKARLAEAGLTYRDLKHAERFYSDVCEWIDSTVESFLNAEIDSFQSGVFDGDPPERDIEIPLRDPQREEPDALREWAIETGYGSAFWDELPTIGAAVESIVNDISSDRSCVCAPVGTLMNHWWQRDETTYFREIELRYAPKDHHRLSADWKSFFSPSLVMFNCIPAAEIERVFRRLGGGVLMSATLEPLEVFREVIGLDTLESDGSDRGRPVVERTYSLQFPPENRASWIVDAMPFTARNRGEPTPDNTNETREKYAFALRSIATSHGNVMVCMPNYREARWAADRLREEIDKPVLLDESSSNEETTSLRQTFFDGGPKVLVTSTRGTLTEGVDYEGEKLHTCAVVGVPLVNIGSPRVRAIRFAYGRRFGEENAFEYALTIPAVRRSRQAIGRVIRGPEERGVRVLIGNRYTPDAYHNSVYRYLPESEREEFVQMTPMFLQDQLQSFWTGHRQS